jgi:hypothetical protein
MNEVDTVRASAKQIGKAEGVTAERGRLKAIMTAKEAKGREEFARYLAFDTDVSADAAIALLRTSPAMTHGAPASGSRLDGLVPQPNVTVGNAEGADGKDGWAAAVAAINGEITGKKRH